MSTTEYRRSRCSRRLRVFSLHISASGGQLVEARRTFHVLLAESGDNEFANADRNTNETGGKQKESWSEPAFGDPLLRPDGRLERVKANTAEGADNIRSLWRKKLRRSTRPSSKTTKLELDRAKRQLLLGAIRTGR